jgi:hypothetical protein
MSSGDRDGGLGVAVALGVGVAVVVAVAVAIVVAVAVAGCSTARLEPSDAGAFDAQEEPISPPPVLFDAGPRCTAQAIDRFTPKPYKPAVAGGVCTADNITSYVQCTLQQSRPACDRVFDAQGSFLPGFAACGPCVETPESAATWGGVVITDEATGDGFNNVAGCLGRLAGDGASATGCGAAAFYLQQCWAAACPKSLCPLSDPPTRSETAYYDACVRQASATVCAAYDATFASRCAAVVGDAATAQCGGGAGASQADHVTAILTILCGGAPGDAGPG